MTLDATDDRYGEWMVYDATADIGSPTGYGIDFRHVYGEEAEPSLVWVEDAEKDPYPEPDYIDVTSDYID